MEVYQAELVVFYIEFIVKKIVGSISLKCFIRFQTITSKIFLAFIEIDFASDS